MKIIVLLVGILAVGGTYGNPLLGDADSVAISWEDVKKVYNTLKNMSVEFVCSAKLEELLDILEVPEKYNGAVKLAQGLICGKSALQLHSSPEFELQSIADLFQKVKEYYNKLKQYSKDFVCSAKLQDLMDLLGVPDALDGAISLAQSYLCKEEEVPVGLGNGLSEVEFIADFWERVKGYYAKLKQYASDFVCSAKLHDLLDLLGVPDDLDGAVKMAQSWLCESNPLEKRSLDQAREGFTDAVKNCILELNKYSTQYVCHDSDQEDLRELCDTSDFVVRICQGMICN